MPKNVSFLMDKSYITKIHKKHSTNFTETLYSKWENTYNYSMWVEVYNASNQTKTLSEYYFTDDLSKPTKWKPLAINGLVAGNGFSVLFFEREDEDAYTSYLIPNKNDDLYLFNRQGHASFKLEPEGGKLYLLNKNLTVVDSVVYPAQYRNISYGRLTDGDSQWVFFEQPSPGSSNEGKQWATQRCSKPVFTLRNGFYATPQTLRFVMPASGDTIYYTTDGSEPTRKSIRYVTNTAINLSVGVSKLRARTFSLEKLTSDIVTNTYFVGQRSFNNLPVISIVTDQKNLSDNTKGIYVTGTNGIPGNGQSTPQNYNQEWDRPVNFEFFDKKGQPQLNQELDISILGGWSRSSGQKSTAISPKDKFGNDKLNYDFFAATKPGHEYKDIQIRNSGNDFNQTQMRDAFMMSLAANRMDVDYLAYEPAVVFMNGSYFGIQNIRERTNLDYVFSNYGYAKDDVELIEANGDVLETKNGIRTDPGFLQLVTFLKSNDVSTPAVYRQICDSIDVDEFINYMIHQIYIANTDWPHNNTKMWRKKNGGKWRWILFDMDYGFNFYTGTNKYHNTLTYALGENGALPEWSYIVFKRLCANHDFVNKLVDRFAIQMATTYKPSRVNYIMDSLANRIDEELAYHKRKWGGSVNDLYSRMNDWKDFAATRNKTIMGLVSTRFMSGAGTNDTLHIDANVAGATYTFNNELIMDKEAHVPYFKTRTISLKANPIDGYRFEKWSCEANLPLLPAKSEWKFYYDTDLPLKKGVPSADWKKTDFDDSAWASGHAPIGHNVDSLGTRIPYSNVDSSGVRNYYSTAYFRKKVYITDAQSKHDFKLNITCAHGAVVYVNGVEVGRINMASGAVSYLTGALSDQNTTTTINVPDGCFKEGENVVAVEVHEFNKLVLLFDMEIMHQTTAYNFEPIFTTTLNENTSVKAHYVKDTEPAKENAIVINELVSNNLDVMDEFGVKEDYIELYNKGSEPVNIGGWYLSDKPDNKLFHQVPTNNPSLTIIQPGDRLILWADDEANQGTLHLGFKLGKEGETILLSRKLDDNSVAIVDSVSYPVLGSQSYSRVPDGSSTWAIQKPTFNTTNTLIDVKHIEKTSIALYSKQITESLTVLNAEGCMVSIIDLTGKVLKREQCASDETIIQIGELNRGIYLVTVGDKTFKVIRR